MKKIIFVCCLTKIFIFNPLVATAQEDGWKDLKWGMTLQEVKIIYEKISSDEGKCNILNANISIGSSFWGNDFWYGKNKRIQWTEIPPKVRDMFVDLWFECYPTVSMNSFTILESNMVFYNNKFFGKKVDVDFKDATSHEIIIKQLKEKYPKGTLKRTFEYPIFEYISERITVFSTPTALYFYDTKTLNEILSNIANEKRNEDELEQQRLKSLF